MALMHAHSMKPTRKPVAKTLGIAINSSDSGYSAGTVLVCDTTNLWVYSIPGLISFIPSLQRITFKLTCRKAQLFGQVQCVVRILTIRLLLFTTIFSIEECVPMEPPPEFS